MERTDMDLMSIAGTGAWLDLTDAPPPPPLDLKSALAAMSALEAGAIANVDEDRQVGHYWLRDPARAPSLAQRNAIEQTWEGLHALEDTDLDSIDDIVIIGIGGSALGPQLLAGCLAQPTDRCRLSFLDNTDPEGFASVLGGIDPRRSLTLVVSKSGGTTETVNGLAAARAHWERSGVPLADHAIALTGADSRLDRIAVREGWRTRFPIWDWVGGRTSITGPVGLVPMALCGWDWRGLLAGASAMDQATRAPAIHNPAARLAQSWFAAGGGRGDRALVVLPYKDRFALVGRYLQQLVMESLGKRCDRQGRVVHQGLVVYGNKGSTDQHAFVQQVRDGRDDVFVHFIETLDPGPACPLPDGLDASDHLLGFLWGTRRALKEAGRPSITLTLPDAGARSLGVLIALFERTVGLYAEMIDLNAYNQPGVEAGKRAARDTLGALGQLSAGLSDVPISASEMSEHLGEDVTLVWRLLQHLAATGRARLLEGASPADDRFQSI